MKTQYGSPAMKRFLTAAMALCLLLSCLIPARAQGGYRPQTPPSGICGPCDHLGRRPCDQPPQL